MPKIVLGNDQTTILIDLFGNQFFLIAKFSDKKLGNQKILVV
jgi:hypothetical protein